MNKLSQLRVALHQSNFSFAQMLDFIDRHYCYTPSAFSNNGVINSANTNQGSGKILALALLEGFSKEEALLAYGEHYRHVLTTPEHTDHANIRALLKGQLALVVFEQVALAKRV